MSTKQKTGAKRGTLFGDFYRSTVRPQLIAKRYSKGYIQNHDYAVKPFEECHPTAGPEDIDDAHLTEFERYLKTGGEAGENYCCQQSWLIRRIVRYGYPYKFLRAAFWREVKQTFEAEPKGCLGKQYLGFERRQKKRRETFDTAAFRSSVKAFHEWRGGPVELEAINDSLLDNFESAEKKRGAKGKSRRPLIYRCCLAQVVNDWQPGRVRDRRVLPPAVGDDGTVQYFAEKLLAEGLFRKHLGPVRTVMRRLLLYREGKALPIAEFTPDLGEDYLQWAIIKGNPRKRLPVSYIDATDRWILNAISNEAAQRGLMRRGLRLVKLGAPRPHLSGYKCAPRKNGHTNGQTAPPTPTPDVEWSDYESPSYWAKVFAVSTKTIKRRIADGTYEAKFLHSKAWRFRVSCLPAAHRHVAK